MNYKQLTAIAAAGAMTLCTGLAMLAISGFSTLSQPPSAAALPTGSTVVNTSLSSDPQVQQLEQAVTQYQTREQQYQQALNQAQTQLSQDQQQLQQYQQLFTMLQQQGVITLRQDGDD
jgi:hypothetical protein